MKSLVFIILFSLCVPLYAVELYGVDLQSANRDQLRVAVKNAGLKMVKQAGQGEFYDQYQSNLAISLSSHLYLGFVKKTQAFAFAEYELEGAQQPTMLLLLEQKYGKAKMAKARFFSDKNYMWETKGIRILLYYDWSTNSTRLIYSNLDALRQLKQEMRAHSIIKNLKLTRIDDKAY